jgi:predicted PurR-regulated permease PerM
MTAPQPLPSGRSDIARMVRGAIVVGVVLLFLWVTIRIDLVICAGILLAVFLRGLAERVRRRTGLPLAVALGLVILAIVVAGAAFGWLFAARIDAQVAVLSEQLPRALQRWRDMLGEVPLLDRVIHGTKLMPSKWALGPIFGVATTTVDVFADVIVFLVIGIYGAAEGGLYRRGVLRLVPPPRRDRADAIVGEAAHAVWLWIIGRLVSMAAIGVTTGLALWAIGVPVPATLGILAGVLNFVPYVGTFLSAVPPILLAAAIRPTLALYVVLVFVAIHVLEGYVLIPLVQRRAAHLPPALLLAAQALLWTLGGVMGIPLAAPLLAVAMVLVRRVYVEDTLGDTDEPLG